MSVANNKQRPAAIRVGRLTCVAVALAGAALFSAPAFALKIPIQATLSGAGEVPPNNSPARGVMQGTFDTDTNTLEWTVNYSGLTSAPIGAHFHGPISYLGPDAGRERADPGRNPRQSRKPLPWVAKIDDAQAKDLKDGRWYFNVHSKQFPAGEIRGPIVRR